MPVFIQCFYGGKLQICHKAYFVVIRACSTNLQSSSFYVQYYISLFVPGPIKNSLAVWDLNNTPGTYVSEILD